MAATPQIRTVSAPVLRTVDSPEVAEQAMTGYRALVARTVGAFGDEYKASRWLSLPNRDLGGQTPLQAVQKLGYDLGVLEPLLIRIEHGVDY